MSDVTGSDVFIPSIFDMLYGRSRGIKPKLSSPDTLTAPAFDDSANSTVSATTGGASDPVMQALLQQLEYTKPSTTTIPASQVSKVTLLPASGQSSGGGAVVLIVLVVLGVGAYFLLGKGKKKHSGGATRIESDH